jgi:hypothetical protein
MTNSAQTTNSRLNSIDIGGDQKHFIPLAQTDPKAKAAKPEDFVDMRFVKELDDSGLLRAYTRIESASARLFV